MLRGAEASLEEPQVGVAASSMLRGAEASSEEEEPVRLARARPQCAKAKARSSTSVAPTSTTEVVSVVKGRYYAVWVLPGHEAFRGIHGSVNEEAWTALLAMLPGGDYQSARKHVPLAALRRADTFAEAVLLYLREAGRHCAPSAFAVHWWSRTDGGAVVRTNE